MLKIYFHPKVDHRKGESQNPYKRDFEKTLSDRVTIVNRNFNQRGVLDLFAHLFRADVYVLNWIENLPAFRFGQIQSIFFILFLQLTRVLDKKILWVLHNKYTHGRQKNRLTDLLFSLMMKHADRIITHSEAGIDFARARYPKYAHKVKYLIHPLKPPFAQKAGAEIKHDILIWGAMDKYKGILPFLQFMHQSEALSGLRVLIVGKCTDPAYKKELEAFVSERVVLKDEFYDLETIAAFANQSRYILFAYKPDSVLSSGSLMDSIRMGTRIIGPDHGAFRDLKDQDFIETYEDFAEMEEIIQAGAGQAPPDPKMIEDFCRSNTWAEFGDRVTYELEKLFPERTSVKRKEPWQIL